MSDQCPHCQGELKDHVPRSRINEKNETIKKLEKELLEAGPKVSGFDNLQSELEQTKAELEKVRTSSTRSLAAARSGFTDDNAMPFLELAYRQSQDGKEEGERVSFEDWIAAEDGAREHPATKGFWQASAAPGAAPSTSSTTPKAGPPTASADGADTGADGDAQKPPPRQPGGKLDAGAKPAGSSKMATPDQWRTYFNSDEYNALPPDKKREQLDAYKAEVRAARGNASA